MLILVSDIMHNFICEQGLTNLIILSLDGNPLAEQLDSYRTYVVFHLPTLKALDGIAVVRSPCKHPSPHPSNAAAVITIGASRVCSFPGGERVWKCEGYVWGEAQPRHGCGEVGPHRLRRRQLPHAGVLLYSVMGWWWQRISRANEWKMIEGLLCFSFLRTVDLCPPELFSNLRSVNLDHNNLTSFSGLIYLPNIKVRVTTTLPVN